MYCKYDLHILKNLLKLTIKNVNKKFDYKLFFSCFIIIYYNLLICIIKKSFYSSLIFDIDIIPGQKKPKEITLTLPLINVAL